MLPPPSPQDPPPTKFVGNRADLVELSAFSKQLCWKGSLGCRPGPKKLFGNRADLVEISAFGKQLWGGASPPGWGAANLNVVAAWPNDENHELPKTTPSGN